MRLRHPLAIVILFTQLFSTGPALGEKLEVSIPQSFERYSVELASGQVATITVYLKSFGDLLDQYQVDLIDEVAHNVVDTAASDKDGIVVFRSKPPSRYVVKLTIPKKIRRITTVSLGDIRITPEVK